MQEPAATPQRPATETVVKVQRRIVLMPRGQKTTAERENRITMPRLRCLEDRGA